MRIRPIQPADLEFVREELTRNWGDTGIWSIGRRYQADTLPGFVALDAEGKRVGLLTYAIQEGGYQSEVVTLSTRSENHGAGTALLAAAVEAAREAGCTRVFLTTTNDNLRALGFYQKRGWKIATIHRGAVDRARSFYPAIPLMGMNGIEIHDEIELEMILADSSH